MSFCATVTLNPVADTTLSQAFPSNNFGAVPFVNSGTTQNFTTNRGLFKFDPAAVIPLGAKIKSARLTLAVTREPADGFNFADFGLHRLLKDWGEGNKMTPTNSQNAGTGAPATTNEATWLYRFAFTSNTWSAPGARAPTDYVTAPSSSQTIYGISDSPYTFASTAQMVADVQLWLEHPETNFGWSLVCAQEERDFSARRFGSREDTNHVAELALEYVAPPLLERPQRSANHFSFLFTAVPGQNYTVEFRDSFSSTGWNKLADIGTVNEVTRVLVVDPISLIQRFYRISSY